jgi:hypothetical protein
MKILGNEFDPVQWECPMVENGLMVGAITLDNDRARKIVEEIKELCDISFANDEQKGQFMYCVHKYNSATAIMRLKREFMDEDIISFQSCIDDFFRCGSHNFLLLVALTTFTSWPQGT